MGECKCVAKHSPAVRTTDVHHIVPKSWGGKTTPSNTVTLCPNAHRDTHALLNEYVRQGGDPGWEVRRHYSTYVRHLASDAWAQRPQDKPPLTVTYPGHE